MMANTKHDESHPTHPHSAPAVPGEQAQVQAGGMPAQAVSAETAEQLAALEKAKTESVKVPPPGSKDYVAGQPTTEEEYDKTNAAAVKLGEAGKKAAEAAAKAAEVVQAAPAEHEDHAKKADKHK